MFQPGDTAEEVARVNEKHVSALPLASDLRLALAERWERKVIFLVYHYQCLVLSIERPGFARSGSSSDTVHLSVTRQTSHVSTEVPDGAWIWGPL